MMFESFNEGVQYAVTPGAFRCVMTLMEDESCRLILLS